ncbi:MAG: ATP-binding cassette domain-containing protein [Desulfurococcales archaeon]|nr:ATP-binding cassette domain-containing protein [Desulfurococcales archaeon]
MECAVKAENLVKVYPGGVRAVDGVSFCIRPGEIFSLLGPNGAGKTTTVKMLATLLKPTDGDARILGYSIRSQRREVRRVIGIVPQELTSDDEMTGWDNVYIQARLYGYPAREARERTRWALEYMGLLDVANRRASTYSGGMRRRLEIAMSIVHKPKVLFLDEPTLGLDVQSRRHLWELIRKLKEEGVTILLTTHYMEEAEELSDRVAIIDRGRIIAEGTPEELISRLGGERIHITMPGPREAESLARELVEAGWKAKALRETVVVTVTRAAEALPRLAPYLRGAREIRIIRPNLEEVFLELTGRSLREGEEAFDSFKYRIMTRRIRR